MKDQYKLLSYTIKESALRQLLLEAELLVERTLAVGSIIDLKKIIIAMKKKESIVIGEMKAQHVQALLNSSL